MQNQNAPTLITYRESLKQWLREALLHDENVFLVEEFYQKRLYERQYL